MSRSSTLLDIEPQRLDWLLPALCVATISGFITYLLQSNQIWAQWTYLLHVFSGALTIIPFIFYLGTHFKRTLETKHPLMTISGVMFAGAIFYVLAGGVQISIFGQTESTRWIYESHVAVSVATLILLISHIVIYRFLVSKMNNNQQPKIYFKPLTHKQKKRVVFWLTVSAATVGSATFIYPYISTPYTDNSVIEPYELPYGENPFSPSQAVSFTGGFLDIRRLSGSEKCGACHTAITEEWKSSMHAQAASDKSYQTNVNLLANKKGMSSTRYCEGCHAPIALLSGELTKGGQLDTPGHMIEGVGCMVCHGIDRVVNLKGLASYRASPKNDYLFANSDNLLAIKLHNYLIEIQPRGHRKDMNRDIIFQPEFCSTCHTQFMDKDVNNWGWVKMQDEYSDWLNSPYSGQSLHEFSNKHSTTCQDCHFPKIKNPDPSANAKGLSSSHRSLGANTAIPYYTGDRIQLELTTQFLQSNKVRINIEKPNRSDATQSKKLITPDTTLEKETPAYYYLGETATINLVVSNTNVGHNFPGGSTDINEVWVHFKVIDSRNKVVYESGALTENNDVDPAAQFYRSLHVDRYGNHVWKHDLFNTVGDSYKKIIKASESDIVKYEFSIPSWVKSPITISAKVRYRKFNNRYARWALDDEGIELPIVDMARDSISIPVRIRKEVNENISEL